MAKMQAMLPQSSPHQALTQYHADPPNPLGLGLADGDGLGLTLGDADGLGLGLGDGDGLTLGEVDGEQQQRPSVTATLPAMSSTLPCIRLTLRAISMTSHWLYPPQSSSAAHTVAIHWYFDSCIVPASWGCVHGCDLFAWPVLAAAGHGRFTPESYCTTLAARMQRIVNTYV
jgi:hypothetical protein